MRPWRLSAVVVGLVLAWPGAVWAGRPVIVTVQHDAVFENLDDYPAYSFYVGSDRGGWQPVRSGAATQINLPAWEGAPVHLYAVPRALADQLSAFPPEEWKTNLPPGVKKSTEPLATRYETVTDYDIIGQSPGFGPQAARLAADPMIPDDPPGKYGPIVPYRYLTTYRVTLWGQLFLSVVKEQTFDKRGNVIEKNWKGEYVIVPPLRATGLWVALLVVADATLLGAILLRIRRPPVQPPSEQGEAAGFAPDKPLVN